MRSVPDVMPLALSALIQIASSAGPLPSAPMAVEPAKRTRGRGDPETVERSAQTYLPHDLASTASSECPNIVRDPEWSGADFPVGRRQVARSAQIAALDLQRLASLGGAHEIRAREYRARLDQYPFYLASSLSVIGRAPGGQQYVLDYLRRYARHAYLRTP